ncbi:MAG: ATP-dependent Lon protease [Chloroflexota bacterium]|jgi:ATP-dependent Lon protease|nr:ATP-dependent Lon protease [Chloroflexota bacterium]
MAPRKPRTLPVIPLREAVLFPGALAPLSVGREASLAALEEAGKRGRHILVVAQKEPSQDLVGPEDVYTWGTVGEIEGVRRVMGSAQLVLRGIGRARIEKFTRQEPYLEAEYAQVRDRVESGLALDALVASLRDAFEAYVGSGAAIPQEAAQAILRADDPGLFADLVAGVPDLTVEQKQELLETPSVEARLRTLVVEISRQREVLELKSRIQSEVEGTFGQAQKEQILREQLKAIRRELGEPEEGGDMEELRAKIDASGMPEKVIEKARREMSRLEAMPTISPEHGMLRSYLDWLVSVPWKESEPDPDWDTRKAKGVLDEDHYGLDKVKERILEYMAVRERVEAQLREATAKADRAASKKGASKGKPAPDRHARSPILCLVGPPGVGKTSLGKSIARALGREVVRVSLGGIRDEAEIRGHRRTYIGALPGRIIQGMRQAGTHNPVFMLDEIDKVGADFRGDPAAALLEALDPEQNREFSDHYLEVAYDLSQVLFITTANIADTIHPALIDRMEVIRIPGYTEEEKLHIAKRYLVPRQLEEHGITARHLSLADATLRRIIREFTHEAGVRSLEREIANVARKVPRRLSEGEKARFAPKAADLEGILGPPRFDFGLAETEDQVGAVTGVAVNEWGGDVMTVEAIVVPGEGDFTLTGQLGKVMEESARAAWSYARVHAARFNVEASRIKDNSVHIHVPAGAIPKDGPSAGVTMTTAIVSALTGRAVRKEVAMTGEITLRGRVLPIGGVKEKLLAAHRAGIKVFMLPRKNRKDLEEVPEEIRNQIEVILVDHVEEVLARALLPATPRTAAAAALPAISA